MFSSFLSIQKRGVVIHSLCFWAHGVYSLWNHIMVDIVEYKRTLADLDCLHMGHYFGAQGTILRSMWTVICGVPNKFGSNKKQCKYSILSVSRLQQIWTTCIWVIILVRRVLFEDLCELWFVEFQTSLDRTEKHSVSTQCFSYWLLSRPFSKQRGY